MPHAEQVALKCATLDALMAQEGVEVVHATQLAPLLGPVAGYRRRARLGVRWVHGKQRVLVGFREKASNFIADIEACEILDRRIGGDLQRLETVIASISCADRIPQIEVAAGDDTLAVIVRHLDPLNADDHARFVDLGESTGWHIYLQPKGPDSVHRIWPTGGRSGLTYRLGELGLEYQFEVTDFTQINAQINRTMILQALTLLELNGTERVLDLFCGLGNFTLALATRAASVTGVEVSQTMVDRVLHNARHNALDRVDAYAFDLTDSVADQPWAQESFDTVVVDPPRSGAKEVLEELPLASVSQLLYVSCNPATLARDAAILQSRGMQLVQYGVMDMFPQTAHVESMARFVQVKSHG
jgi:23S rRNA (uracil1939-C5)-methyltransferase